MPLPTTLSRHDKRSWWDVLPFVTGAAFVAYFSVLIGHFCHVGTEVYPKVERGTPRFSYCFEKLPGHPWLALAVPSLAVLALGALALRRHRLVAWSFVAALVVAMLVFANHISGLTSYDRPNV